MKLRFQNAHRGFLLIVLLAAILAALAALQYRWIGELSAAERERLQKTARVAAENLCREFDREITRAFIQLQVNPSAVEKNPADYAAAYERWQTATVYPKLVKSVFVAEKNETGAVDLKIFNYAGGKFEKTDWLPEFDQLQKAVERELSGQKISGEASAVRLAAEIPALAIPISPLSSINLEQIKTAAASGRFSGAMTRRIGYTIILLDADYLKNELLPALAARYFESPEVSAADRFDVAVMTRRAPAQFFYRSADFQNDSSVRGDVEQLFFSPRLNEIANLRLTGGFSKTATRLPEIPAGKKVAVSIVTAAGAPNGNAADALFGGAFEAGWRLVVSHRGGSFDAVVGKTRRRNLLVSGAILLLLGAGGAMIVGLANRTRNFAQQQNDFIASVSHELRTPLAVIRSMSENLADGIVSESANIRQYGALIRDEERRLSAMVEQMLGFAGAQQTAAGKNKFAACRINEIVEAALGDYRRELEKPAFETEILLAADLPPIEADADALRRAVGNLIGNAIKYSGAARRITLETRADAQSKNVRIIVADQGYGIDARDLPEIFKLFYRGAAAVENQIEGSGIGLSLVRQIVENHGGTISAASEIGRGSVFTITLPAAAEKL